MKRTAASVVLLLCIMAGAIAAEPDPVVRYTKAGRFEDVRDDLKLAIESRGLVIDSHAHILRMLERTGKDIGSTRPIYRGAEAFSFCSASLSRKMMEADPASVVQCPYSLVVYETLRAPGQVVVAYRRPAQAGVGGELRAALVEVEQLLDRLAREAAGVR